MRHAAQLEASAVERALTEALSQWRVSRCEQLALNIDSLHELIVRGRPQFADGRWNEICARRRDSELPGLLCSLPAIGDPNFGPRLDALRAFQPDPHLAQTLRWRLEDCEAPADRALWRRVFGTLAWVGDPRTRRWLLELVASQRAGTTAMRGWLRAEVASLTGALPMPSSASTPLPVLPRVPLLSQLTDTERLVTADWLSSNDDPLGEFLVLQYSPLQHTQARRMRALQVAHARRWLGPLSRALRLERLRFERGVLVEGMLSGVRALELGGHPGWSALRTLDLRHLRGVVSDRVGAFLRQPVLGGLRALTGVPEDVALQLTEDTLPFPLERLQIIDSYWHRAELLGRLQAARSLRSVRSLEHDGQRWERSDEGEWRKAS